VRAKLRFLNDELMEKIISEAIHILCSLGVGVHNKGILAMLADHGARVDTEKWHAVFTERIIEKSLKTVPRSFTLYDVNGNKTHCFEGYNVQFTPGSTALHVLDHNTKELRKPTTEDYVNYVKVVGQLDGIASQSTAFIPADVATGISDSYRLFLSLLYGEKPVVTGAFAIESFAVMKDLQVLVRGTKKALKEKPLTIFSCCPTSPLKWSEVTSQNLVDCARCSIPVEFVAMPLSGFMAPVTLVGTLIQHTAETLSGVVISQLANPGAPVLYGGSPAIFDMRHSTTPMGAIETMMVDCAYNEIGKHFGIPTQAYISLSDAKQLDAQAGLETGIGATLAALAGINSISGPGMLDFESCQSLEKLILDNEICRMALRAAEGIEPRDDFPAQPLFEELLAEGQMLTSTHTLTHLRTEHVFPGPVIDRANRERWKEDGRLSLEERAHREVERLVASYTPSRLPETTKRGLVKRMEEEARRFGQEKLPKRPE